MQITWIVIACERTPPAPNTADFWAWRQRWRVPPNAPSHNIESECININVRWCVAIRTMHTRPFTYLCVANDADKRIEIYASERRRECGKIPHGTTHTAMKHEHRERKQTYTDWLYGTKQIHIWKWNYTATNYQMLVACTFELFGVEGWDNNSPQPQCHHLRIYNKLLLWYCVYACVVQQRSGKAFRCRRHRILLVLEFFVFRVGGVRVVGNVSEYVQ